MMRRIGVSLLLFSWSLFLWFCCLLNGARADEKTAPKVSGEIKGSFQIPGLPKTKVAPEPKAASESKDASPISAATARQIKLLENITRKLSTPVAPAPQRTLIYGTTFPVENTLPEYSGAVQKFIEATGATALVTGEMKNLSPLGQNELRRGRVEIRGEDAAQIAAFVAAPPDEKIAIVNLSENLVFPLPENSDAFRVWLQARDLPLGFLDEKAKSWNEIHFSLAPETAIAKPALYYYSQLFAREFALNNWAAKTAEIQRAFPNAGVLGRFAESGENSAAKEIRLGEATSQLSAFQKKALTSPRVDLRAADSIFDFYETDLLRAGIRGRETDLDSKIYAKISAPTKENSNAWRKRFYAAIAHGAKTFDIGNFQPTEISAPRELKRAFSQLSTFENIVQDGKVKSAQTALLVSETGDIWNNATAARRALYNAARGSQIPLDFLAESEVQKGDLKNYKVLLLADRNLSRKAAKAVFDWVQSGGTLIATAGAGMRDELDKKNILLFEQWDIRELEYSENSATNAQKANPVSIGSVQWKEIKTPIFDARSRFDIGENRDGTTAVLAIFEDGAPAIVSHRAGEGLAIYAGFRPNVEAAKNETSKTDLLATQLMQFVLKRVYRPVVCFVGADEIPAVETNVIESAVGIAIPFINRSGKPIEKLVVRVPFIAGYNSCALASGGRVLLKRDELGLFAIFDLDAADALIFK